MALIEEDFHAGAFLASEANGTRSRRAITVASGQTLKAGAVLGKVETLDEVTRTADAGNTGDGAMTLAEPAAADGAAAGDYRVLCIEPASNAGTFAVFDPAGVQIGTATVAVAFDGQVKFTIADGATDFVAGDGFTVTVANEGETWTELDPDATDGSEVAAGLLYAPVDATDAALPGVAVVREAEVKSACLVWPAGITDAQKAAALAELEFLGVFAR